MTKHKTTVHVVKVKAHRRRLYEAPRCAECDRPYRRRNLIERWHATTRNNGSLLWIKESRRTCLNCFGWNLIGRWLNKPIHPGR